MNRRRFVAGTLVSAAAASSLRPQPRLIDSHVHVWKRDDHFPFATGAKPPEGDFSAEALLALMAANGVSRTVLIQVIHYRWDNRYLADVLRRYPGKFRAVCRVNPEDPAAPDRLSQLTAQGFRGVRLSPAAGADGDWIRGPLMPPLWRRCAELKVPMTILAPVARMPDLVPLIERAPGLTVVIDHWPTLL
jgi:L-fuconolactonase